VVALGEEKKRGDKGETRVRERRAGGEKRKREGPPG
jgi:hypothetical protein